ncbi:MAG: amidohydrolase family protein [Pirellulaceae bacterium]
MTSIPLHFHWAYTDVDRAFWEERLADWLPRRILDAHTHVADPSLRLTTMTEVMRRQYWVNEVFEPIDAPTAGQCHHTVFPNREFTCVAMSVPDLGFDIEGGNRYLQQECPVRGWYSLAVIRPQWTQEHVAALLDAPSVIGVKPYYSLISPNDETRDAHLEASIFDFLPHHILEVVNDRHAWVTLHVPKADRLGHVDNVREVREIRQRYPDITLVIAHLGRCYTEPHALEALPQFADDPGLYFDTSAVLNPASHRAALRYLGPQRLLYGSDNPVFYMRGRRQYRDRSYVNRTSHPFHFNRDRESPEVEATYTLLMYEDLHAIRQACDELDIRAQREIEAVFHDNAARLIEDILARKKSRLKGRVT